LNTCSIREKAEQTIRKRLTEFKKIKKQNPGLLIGILGCMAERLKSKLLEEEKLVDIVVGPDAYRTLPGLIEEAETGTKAVNVLLSREETYADISPVRINSNGINAFVSIMRGCNNMCAFCVVPFTRGRERSRDNISIINECKDLFQRGFKEVTLLGQNVDSYYWVDPITNHAVDFAMLLEQVALISPNNARQVQHLAPKRYYRKGIANDEILSQHLQIHSSSCSKRFYAHSSTDESHLHQRMVLGESEKNQGNNARLCHQLGYYCWILYGG